MNLFKDYQLALETAIGDLKKEASPDHLYRPVEYLLSLGGKRIRPYLTMMSGAAYGANLNDTVGAAMAVEVFHNFTLMHDDVMDQAPLRRGHATVHKKWNLNNALLSGDAMLIMAYQSLELYPDTVFKQLTSLLSKTAIEVCEGQQYDMDFETNPNVSQEDYIEMIRLKTAVLVGCALKMGAIIGKASEKDQMALYDFGIQLGLAFQLQDDYLDAFGNQETFGKKIGGDILEDKKTILYHLALKKATPDQRKSLQFLLGGEANLGEDQKINSVKSIFEDTGAKSDVNELIQHHANMALLQLEKLSISTAQKNRFVALKDWLMQRTF